MNIKSIIDEWVGKNSDANLESDVVRKSLSDFIENHLENSSYYFEVDIEK